MSEHGYTDQEIKAHAERTERARALCRDHEDAMVTVVAILNNLEDSNVCECPRCSVHKSLLTTAAGVLIAEIAMSSSRHPLELQPVINQRLALLTAPVTS